MIPRNDLGKMLKQRRIMIPLTLRQLATAAGVSQSHLGRVERGERFPSASVLKKIGKPLGFEEGELLIRGGYLSPQPSAVAESGAGAGAVGVDPYVANVLAQEPVEVQRNILGILIILKSLARGNNCNIGFAEYAHRNYPEVDEDTITMIEDIVKHVPRGRS